MTKKFHILLIVLTLGIFLTPRQTYACGTNSAKAEKSCCKKEKKATAEKKDCCKNHNSKKHQNDDGCGGKCNHSSCQCPTFNFAFTLPFVAELTKNNFEFSSKKQKFYHNETYLSSGFLSIWTPPNIS